MKQEQDENVSAYVQSEKQEHTLRVTNCEPTDSVVDICITLTWKDLLLYIWCKLHRYPVWIRVVSTPNFEDEGDIPIVDKSREGGYFLGIT